MRGWRWFAVALFVLLIGSATAFAGRLEAVRLPGLALRDGSGNGARMIRALQAGATVTVLGREGKWIHVALADGTTGYVYGGFLTGFADIVPFAPYAARMDPQVVRPVQPKAQPVAATAAEPARPATPVTLPRPEPAVVGPWKPTADGAGLNGLLLRLIEPAKARALADKMPPGDFNERKNRYSIEVHLSERRLYLYENMADGSHHLVRTYQVAVPRHDMEAPQGWGVVTAILFEPWWRPTPAMKLRAKKKGKQLPEAVKPGAKDNPMGTFKIILSHGNGFRIHGNNNPSSIGHSVTSGCIRMRNSEGEHMAKMIEVGTEVVFLQ